MSNAARRPRRAGTRKSAGSGGSITLTASSIMELETVLGALEAAQRAAGPQPPRFEFRLRVGDYRVIYQIDDAAKAIDITRIAHRKEVYES